MDYKEMVIRLLATAAEIRRQSKITSIDDLLNSAITIIDVLSPEWDDGQDDLYDLINMARKALKEKFGK